MQKALLWKLLTIGGLIILLMIPLVMINSLVGERRQRQHEVNEEIAASYAAPQQLIGPVVALPWTRIKRVHIAAADDKPAHDEERRTEGLALVFPGTLDVNGSMSTDLKSRGLFHTRVYQWSGTLQGQFELPSRPPIEAAGSDERIEWGQPWLALGVTDPRGLVGSPELAWNGRSIVFEKGSRLRSQGRGIHAMLPAWQPGTGGKVNFTVKLGLRGTERFDLVPVGDQTNVVLDSGWPHPSFGGHFLPNPESQTSGAEGFHAVWSISALAADTAQQLRDAEREKSCGACSDLDSLSVTLVDPVAIYTLSDRALKYAHLFIVLSFAAFFLFEVLKGLPIHPMQYLLVGLALALFFLLLISLSEHLSFALSYLIATLACCGLIGFYLSAVLQRALRGWGFGLALSGLFGALWVLLNSEDNALLMGSGLLFALLAGAMVVTRRVNWYALGGTRVAR